MHAIVQREWSRLLSKKHDRFVEASNGPTPIRTHLLENGMFSPSGLFKKVLEADTQILLSWVEENGKIVSYAMCAPLGDVLQGHTPDRIGAQCLGFVGAWTAPDRRNSGLASKALSNLGGALTARHDKFYLMCEERMLWAGKRLPLVLLPKRACDQPSNQEIVKSLRGSKSYNIE